MKALFGRGASASALRATADKSPADRRSALRFSTVRQVVMTSAFVTVGANSPLFACPVCFGAAESPLIDGAKLGVLVMVAITLVVQGAFVGFFLYLRNRAKRIAEIELDTEWSELQRASR